MRSKRATRNAILVTLAVCLLVAIGAEAASPTAASANSRTAVSAENQLLEMRSNSEHQSPSVAPSVPTPYAILLPLISLQVPPSPSMMGANVECKWFGATELCASVSSDTVPRYSNVTVYGRLYFNGSAQPNLAMSTIWYYDSGPFYCGGTTGADGVASCKRYIGEATAGYTVNVDVLIGGNSVQTHFTPY